MELGKIADFFEFLPENAGAEVKFAVSTALPSDEFGGGEAGSGVGETAGLIGTVVTVVGFFKTTGFKGFLVNFGARERSGNRESG